VPSVPERIGVELPCNARVIVSVRVERAGCRHEDCRHPTAREAIDMIRLAYLEADVKENP